MEHIGIDVHKRDSQVEIITEKGEVIQRRIRTERDRFREVLGQRGRAKVLLEASTESEWVARCIEELGHEVIVADPNFAPMYLERTRKVKTDRRDAHALAIACLNGFYRKAHRTSEKKRRMRAQLSVREGLVRARARSISVVESLLRREGYRVRSGSADCFLRRVEAVEGLPNPLKSEIGPMLAMLVVLNRQIDYCNRLLERLVESHEEVKRLCTVPNVGPVTAAAFVAAVDDPSRFQSAHELEAYLGMVPRERSSGETTHRGPITKVGGGRVRLLLVQACWGILVLRRKDPRTETLRQWGEGIAGRRGKKIAVVALARRLAGVLFAMMRDETDYAPRKIGAGAAKKAA